MLCSPGIGEQDLPLQNLLDVRGEVGAHLQLGPLDPAHAARRVPPGMLGPVDQLRVPQLVRVSGLNLLGHLLQPLHVGLGAGSGKVGSRGGGGSGRGQGMLQLSTWNTLFLHTHRDCVNGYPRCGITGEQGPGGEGSDLQRDTTNTRNETSTQEAAADGAPESPRAVTCTHGKSDYGIMEWPGLERTLKLNPSNPPLP